MKKKQLSLVVSVLVVMGLLIGAFGCAAPTTTPTEPTTPTAPTTPTEPTTPTAPTTPTEPEEQVWPEVYTIGALIELTGAAGATGQEKANGIRLAINQINASGELPFNLECVFVDHKGGDVALAEAGARKLVDIYHVPFIISSYDGPAEVATTVGEATNVVVINGGGAFANLLYKKRLFITRGMDFIQSPAVVDFLHEEFDCKRIAHVAWQGASAIYMQNATIHRAEELGMEVVSLVETPKFTTDFRSVLADIKSKNPDGISLQIYVGDTGYFRQQAHEMGLDVPMVTTWGIYQQAIDAVGDDLLGLYGIQMDFDANSPLPMTQKFVTGWRELYATEPWILGANYYEATYILKDCIKYILEQGGDPFKGEELEKAIMEIGTFDCVFGEEGKITVQPNCYAPPAYAIYEYQGGAMTDLVRIKEITLPALEPYLALTTEIPPLPYPEYADRLE